VSRIASVDAAGSESELNERNNMKKTLITLGCALVAPLAFAQTSTTTTESTAIKPTTDATTTTESTTTKPVTSTATSESTTTTTSTEGTVSTFTPGKTIVVRRTGVTDPISYTLGKTVTYVNRAGKTIEASLIRPGVPVHVYYDAPGSTTVTRVVVDQD
jgi:hypothetical protein